MSITALGTAGTANYASATKIGAFPVSLGRAIPAGNFLVIAVTLEGAGGVLSTLTASDIKGNVYTAGPAVTDGSTRAVYLITAPVTSALSSGNSITITSTNQNRGRWNIVVEEFSGVAAAAVDASGSGTGSATGISIATTAATTQADELVFGAFSVGPLQTVTAGTGFDLGGTSSTAFGSGDHKLVTEYQSVSATGVQTAAASQSSTGGYAAAVVTLKAAVSVTYQPTAVASPGWTVFPGGTGAAAAITDNSDTTGWRSPDNPTGASPLNVTYPTTAPGSGGITPPTSSQSVTIRTRVVAAGVGASPATVTVQVYRNGTTLVQEFTGLTVPSSVPSWVATTLSGASVAAITAAGAWNALTTKVLATAAP